MRGNNSTTTSGGCARRDTHSWVRLVTREAACTVSTRETQTAKTHASSAHAAALAAAANAMRAHMPSCMPERAVAPRRGTQWIPHSHVQSTWPCGATDTTLISISSIHYGRCKDPCEMTIPRLASASRGPAPSEQKQCRQCQLLQAAMPDAAPDRRG